MANYSIDERSAGRIATLLPAVQEKAIAYLQAVNDGTHLPARWAVKIIQGTRTYAEQAELYAQGRTTPGRIVTNAGPGQSLHNFGIAFDIGIFNEHGDYIDDVIQDADGYYINLAPVGKNLGLEWGGDWQSIKDFPHYQLNPHGYTLVELRSRRAEDLPLI